MPAFKYDVPMNPLGTTIIAFPSLASEFFVEYAKLYRSVHYTNLSTLFRKPPLRTSEQMDTFELELEFPRPVLPDLHAASGSDSDSHVYESRYETRHQSLSTEPDLLPTASSVAMYVESFTVHTLHTDEYRDNRSPLKLCEPIPVQLSPANFKPSPIAIKCVYLCIMYVMFQHLS